MVITTGTVYWGVCLTSQIRSRQGRVRSRGDPTKATLQLDEIKTNQKMGDSAL